MEITERAAGRSSQVLSFDVRAEVDRARSTQLEAVRLAQASTRQWRRLARRIIDEGLTVQEAARLMEVSPARVRDLLSPEGL